MVTIKNGNGKGKPNSADKVSSQSVVLEERHTVRVTGGGTADSESDSTRVRCSSDVVSLIERQGSDVLRRGLAIRVEVVSRGFRRTRTRTRRKRDGKLWRRCHGGCRFVRRLRRKQERRRDTR